LRRTLSRHRAGPYPACSGFLGALCSIELKSRRQEFQPPPATIPRSIGHRLEWIKACKDHKPEDTKAGFAYSGPYSEALLVGNLALRLQKRIEWDAANMRASNASEADDVIHKRYRQGFGIGT
jgi:hypothetical protein